MAMQSLKNKVAIVTGASRGIGREIALALAREGMKLALVARDEKALNSLKKQIADTRGDVFVYPCDLQDTSQPEIIVKKSVEHFGSLDVLINNAGIALPKSFEETTPDEWERHINLNARAPFFLCQYALKYLKKSDCAAIINVASIVGTKGYVNQAAYTASKHALLGWTKVLAQETQKHNVRVHVISPGGVLTGLTTNMRPDIEKSDLILPEEIAEIVVFLLRHRGNAMIDEVNIRRVTKQPWA